MKTRVLLERDVEELETCGGRGINLSRELDLDRDDLIVCLAP